MKNVKTIITLLIGATIGFSFCRFFHSNYSDDTAPVAAVENNSKTLTKQVSTIEKQNQQKEDSLNLCNDRLNIQLKQTETALGKARKRNNQLQQQVYTLIDRQGIYKEEKDTASYYSNCDSLAKLTSQLIFYTDEQDSLSQISIQTLGAQVQNKDAAIVLKLSQYQSLKTALTQSLSQQLGLEKETKQLRNKIRRHRFWGKVKTAGLLVLSGLAARQLMH
jgi:hypothetical protein